jgi:hypothetical protein
MNVDLIENKPYNASLSILFFVLLKITSPPALFLTLSSLSRSLSRSLSFLTFIKNFTTFNLDRACRLFSSHQIQISMKKLLYKWDKYKLGRRLHYLQKRLVRAESNGYDDKIANYKRLIKDVQEKLKHVKE